MQHLREEDKNENTSAPTGRETNGRPVPWWLQNPGSILAKRVAGAKDGHDSAMVKLQTLARTRWLSAVSSVAKHSDGLRPRI